MSGGENGGWHLEKSTSIRQIASIISMALMMFWWASKQESRIEALEIDQKRSQEAVDGAVNRIEDVRIEADVKRAEVKKDLEGRLIRIEDKLDRLITFTYTKETK